MRLEKTAILEELRKNLQGAAFVIVANYKGMKVSQANELRRRLSKTKARLQVVKNSLFRKISIDQKWGDPQAAMSGPIAVIFGPGDVIETAKLLSAFCHEQRLPVIQLGVLDGHFLSAADVDVLVKLPARPVLYGMLVGTLAAPMMRLAGVLHQKAASLIYVLKAIEEKKSKTQ